MLERRSVSEVLWARKLLADPRGAPKTGHRWTPERVFRTFGGGSAESAVLVIESGLMSAPPRLQSRAAQVSNANYPSRWIVSECRRHTRTRTV